MPRRTCQGVSGMAAHGRLSRHWRVRCNQEAGMAHLWIGGATLRAYDSATNKKGAAARHEHPRQRHQARLAVVSGKPCVHGHRRPGADARYRRQHRDLLRRQRRAVEADPLRLSRHARHADEHERRRDPRSGRVASKVHALSRPDRRARARDGVSVDLAELRAR